MRALIFSLLCGGTVFCFGMWVGSLTPETPCWNSAGWAAGAIFCGIYAMILLANKSNLEERAGRDGKE